jgi:hypothetical protein
VTEVISIRRNLKGGVAVAVTRKCDGVSVYWVERVLGPTPDKIADAVRVCRRHCVVLSSKVKRKEEADEVE